MYLLFSGGYSLPTVRECQFRLLILLNLLVCCTFSEALAFLPSHKNSVLKLLRVALAECKSAGSTSFLPQTLPDVVFHTFELLARSSPLDRHPATVKLKQIYATLRVRTFLDLSSPLTELRFI